MANEGDLLKRKLEEIQIPDLGLFQMGKAGPANGIVKTDIERSLTQLLFSWAVLVGISVRYYIIQEMQSIHSFVTTRIGPPLLSYSYYFCLFRSLFRTIHRVFDQEICGPMLN